MTFLPHSLQCQMSRSPSIFAREEARRLKHRVCERVEKGLHDLAGLYFGCRQQGRSLALNRDASHLVIVFNDHKD